MIPSDEQILIRDTARAFALEHLAPNAAHWDRESRFPTEAVTAMADLGFFGMLAPPRWGGSDAGHVAFAMVVEEIAAGDGGCSTILSVQTLAETTIARYGSEAQMERFLKPMALGEMLGAFALSEPQAGSDASALCTRARRDGNQYVLNGTKQFITSGASARVAVVFAVTDPDADRNGISAFIVPTDTPGWRVARIERKLGQHCSDTAQIVLDDVRLTPDLLLGGEGEGYRIALSNLEGGRIGIAAQAVGMARAAFEHARAYARQRETFGKRLADHQAVAFHLADMATGIEVARQMVLHAAALRDAGLPCLKEASMAKLFASDMAERVCSEAIQIHGGYGYLEDFPVERIFRDVRVCRIYEGANDIQRLLIGRAVLEEDEG